MKKKVTNKERNSLIGKNLIDRFIKGKKVKTCLSKLFLNFSNSFWSQSSSALITSSKSLNERIHYSF